MYVPRFNTMEADEARRLVAAVGSAQLITVAEDGYPAATLLPVLWDEDRLVFHMARANPHWRSIRPGSPALAVVSGAEAYVSPAWYPSKDEHGRVVPTWNYITAHIHGTMTVHDDPAWVEDVVRRLSDRHESGRAEPWSVDDAPAKFVSGQLRAIVGVEIAIQRIEAKFKLSQNRPAADVDGVIAGLRADGDDRSAAAVEHHRPV